MDNNKPFRGKGTKDYEYNREYSQGKYIKATAVIPIEYKEQFLQAVNRSGVTRSQWVATAIIEKLQRDHGSVAVAGAGVAGAGDHVER